MRKVLLAGIHEKESDDLFEAKVVECQELIRAAGLEVAETWTQKSRTQDTKTAFRSGKYQEFIERARQEDIDLVVFMNNLTLPVLARMQEDTGKEVMDRTSLILDIFSMRARTREAQIQTEIARLRYNMPRLVALELDPNREHGAGGAGGGAYNRGSGETKVEMQRRKIGRQIHHLKKELAEVQKQASVQKKRRQNSSLKRVALVGYTNAGKSSLMNLLLKEQGNDDHKQVFQEDMLFATLDTTVRQIRFPDGTPFLLYDTVGFVSDLPTLLVEAFKSTLDAAKEADLLVHIVDVSNPLWQRQEEVTLQTLKEIGADQVDLLTVYNKIDRVNQRPSGLSLSCLTQEGLPEVLAAIKKQLYPHVIQIEGCLPYEKMALVSKSKEAGWVVSMEEKEEGIWIQAQGPEEQLKLLQEAML